MCAGRTDVVGQPASEAIFAKAAEQDMPIFLHGGGAASRQDPTLDQLEDRGQGVAVSVLADSMVSEFV